MQSSNHVYGHQKAADDDWLICKAVWHLYLKHTPEHVPLSLSNLLRLLPCVLSDNIQNHFWLVFHCTSCKAAQTRERFESISMCLLYKQEIHHFVLVYNFPSPCSYRVQRTEDLFQSRVNVLDTQLVFISGKQLGVPERRDRRKRKERRTGNISEL